MEKVTDCGFTAAKRGKAAESPKHKEKTKQNTKPSLSSAGFKRTVNCAEGVCVIVPSSFTTYWVIFSSVLRAPLGLGISSFLLLAQCRGHQSPAFREHTLAQPFQLSLTDGAWFVSGAWHG